MFKFLLVEKHISEIPPSNCRQYSFLLMKKYVEKNIEKPVENLILEYFKISKKSLEEYKKWILQKKKNTANQFLMRSQ